MNHRWPRWLPGALQKSFSGRASLQAIIGNTGWLLADKAVRLVLAVVVNAWVARYLGPDQYGQLNYAVAISTLFAAIATLGLDGVVVRELVRYPQNRHEILGAAFMLRFLGGCVAFALALLAIWLIRPGDAGAAWLVGIVAAGMIFHAFDTIDFWFQSRIRSRYAACARSFAFFAVSAVKIWLIFDEAPLIAFAWAGFVEIALGSLGLVLAYRAAGNTMGNWRVRLPFAGGLLRESWPLLLSGLATMLYMRLDIVMLRELAGEREAGLYSAVVKVSEVLYLLPAIIVSSTFPVVVGSRDADYGKYQDQLRHLYAGITWLAFSLSLAFCLLSGWVVAVLYGPAYSGAASVLAVHVWASIAVFLGVASGQHLLAEGLQKIALYRTLLGASCNVVLNIVLIPRMGMMGAAIATVVSYFLATYSLMLFPSSRAHGMSLLRAPLPEWKR